MGGLVSAYPAPLVFVVVVSEINMFKKFCVLCWLALLTSVMELVIILVLPHAPDTVYSIFLFFERLL